ncbi:hypothetical protein NDU88_000616, partial [Pleurodeles waltl]
GCRDGVGWWTPRAVSGTIEEKGKKEQNKEHHYNTFNSKAPKKCETSTKNV